MASSGVPFVAVQAMQHQRYSEAIPLLETYCKQAAAAGAIDKHYYQAQVWLVKAHNAMAQTDRAIALCQEMLNSRNAKIQTWAQQTLATLGVDISELPASEPIAPEPLTSEPPVPEYPQLTPEQAATMAQEGNKALKRGSYAEAVEKLEAYCYGTDPSSKDYEQTQTWLAKAYKNNGQTAQAIALCQQLLTSQKPFIKIWAEQYLLSLAPKQQIDEADPRPDAKPDADANDAKPDANAGSSSSFVSQTKRPAPSTPPTKVPKAGRSTRRGVTLAMKGVASNLALASSVTLFLMFGMVLVTTLNLLLIQGAENPLAGLISALFITLIVNLLIFLLAPLLMDLVQSWLYGTRWVSLSEVERYSPETGRIIRMVCQDNKLQQPRLGIIDDQNPTAFTYGSLPNSARLVVSQGLFTYLDDDEVAAVYAHELGHIVHWDFAVMTLASTLVQVCYLIYTYTREVADKLGDSDMAKKVKNGAQSAVIMAYVFYRVGEYLLLYLSRTREYYADHFAAEVTGNPNGLSRALVKIAYGILEEGSRAEKPSKVLQGTRALGISDPRASTTGTAYRMASDPTKVGRVFLWDMFNPWAWWMELNSTHPLTGKRVRALTNYAEQLGLETEFDMARVIQEGRSLNKKKLYGSFAFDVLLYWAEWIGGLGGLLLGGTLLAAGQLNLPIVVPMLMLFGFGFGTLLKAFVMYPALNRAPEMDVLLLMSDPYASPLRGKPVRLAGQVIGRGDAGYRFGSDLKMQDPTGLIYLHYASRFGPLGNFLFGMSQADSFTHKDVAVTGWFRRGVMPWVDMGLMKCPEKWDVSSHHRFWSVLLGAGAIVLAFVLPILAAG
jgi:Zn-dependent protease with chaperone function